MNNKMSNQQNNNGIGFFGLLTIVFIVLKLTGYIDWSWLRIFSPLIASLGLFMLALLILGIVFYFE